jgi:hypothetical protein
MPNHRERAAYPPNAERMVSLKPEELEHLLPMEPDWAVAGAMYNPRTGGLILHIRQDGLPKEDPPLAGGRIYISIEASAEEIKNVAHDIHEYFKSRDMKRVKVGFLDGPNCARMEFAS